MIDYYGLLALVASLSTLGLCLLPLLFLEEVRHRSQLSSRASHPELKELTWRMCCISVDSFTIFLVLLCNEKAVRPPDTGADDSGSWLFKRIGTARCFLSLSSLPFRATGWVAGKRKQQLIDVSSWFGMGENQTANPLTWLSAYSQVKHTHTGPCAWSASLVFNSQLSAQLIPVQQESSPHHLANPGSWWHQVSSLSSNS